MHARRATGGVQLLDPQRTCTHGAIEEGLAVAGNSYNIEKRCHALACCAHTCTRASDGHNLIEVVVTMHYTNAATSTAVLIVQEPQRVVACIWSCRDRRHHA